MPAGFCTADRRPSVCLSVPRNRPACQVLAFESKAPGHSRWMLLPLPAAQVELCVSERTEAREQIPGEELAEDPAPSHLSPSRTPDPPPP
ncbi:hypothetical protein AAFF_G00134840 [Aldrovandia affinis]|uniref:Uncharacterized protein n=1 Tax=Aldrovandia affinis TaxID=143900 RepID=A0AAD7RQE8_9TELE|nr:hypothetical protein AAFF_G00134840 [Aldrovandia affinis]